MSNYALGVVAHVDRQKQIDYLSRVAKPDLIEVDDGTLGPTANHILTLNMMYQSAHRAGQEWVVVLEDDAILSNADGWHRQLNAVLDVAPSPVVSLYNGGGYPMQYQRRFAECAARDDIHFILHRHMRHALGYAMHTDTFTERLIEHLTQQAARGWPPDDSISHWCRRYDKLVAYTNPSIVDHEDGPSVIKNRTGIVRGPVSVRRYPRHAHWVGSRMNWDPTRVDNV